MSSAVGIAERIAQLNTAWDDTRVDRCEVVTDFLRLEELSAQWERLWESDIRAEIFQTPEWGRAWWRAFGHNYTLCSVVVFSGAEVVGIVPLVRSGQRLQFLGTPEADYADIICEERHAPEVLALAFQTLLEKVDGWKECSFRHLSKHSRLVRYYDTLPRDIRSRLHCVPAESQHTIILRNGRDEIFQSLLGKHHTRRLQNKLRKAGRLEFRHLETPQEAERYLPEFFRHHVRRHAAVGRQSACGLPETQQFISGIIRELTPGGRVRFGVLELNGRGLAWALGFHANGKYLLYQHTFDLDAWHYTPGEVLLWNTLEYARDHVTREFDFGKGDELYKDRFANYSRETYSMFLEPRSVSGTLRGTGRDLQAFIQPDLWKIKEMAKGHRTTLRTFRAVRMWMMGTCGCFRQARKNGAVLKYGLHLARELFRASILSEQSNDVFGRQTSLADAARPLQTEVNPDIELQEARLGDLVDLAWEHPEILSLSELAECRRRLKNGDRAFIVHEKSRIAIVCWLANPCAADDTSSPLVITPGTPALAMDVMWSARNHDTTAGYRLLLSALACEAAKQKSDLLVHCSSDQPLLRKELDRQGFAPRFHTMHLRVFSRFRRDSVSAYKNHDVHSPQPA